MVKDLTVIASGGITCPLDVIKAGVMGAQAVGVAGYFLHEYYQNGEDGLLRTVLHWQEELKRIMTILGCQHFNDLPQVPHVFGADLQNYIQQRL
ncbi:isopentenyl-diphosphate delta-isomerase, type 2 [Limosilactobacillus coleohominis DSM 14060]|nr:isopentenyl-diphosphate delta-isomerase, type 2 [Limosilactobacillus coleohominis DSM 14060]